MEISNQEFDTIKKYLRHITGIDVSEEKRYLFTLRLKDILKCEMCNTFSEFNQKLISGKFKYLDSLLIEAMTNHESGFFRDVHPFKTFSEIILPDIAKRRLKQASFKNPMLRILSAGCSFGQEPYSIALCVNKWLKTQANFTLKNIFIVGIDISSQSLEKAKSGVYTDLELGKNISSQDRQLYFVQKLNTWNLSEEIRNMVTFRQANLSRQFIGLGKFDIIFCRNVMIYFSIEQCKTVLSQLRNMMEVDSILFIGTAENMVNQTRDFMVRSNGPTSWYVIS